MTEPITPPPPRSPSRATFFASDVASAADEVENMHATGHSVPRFLSAVSQALLARVAELEHGGESWL